MTRDITSDDKDLHFSPGFAARVVDEVDSVATRQRKFWQVASSATAIVLAGAAVTGIFGWPSRQRPAAPVNTPVVVSIDVGATASTSNYPTDPVDYMFPDARTLARFSDDYSGVTGVTARQNILFADDMSDPAGM